MNPELSPYLVLDLDSGRFFNASNAYLLDTRRLEPDERQLFEEGSDSDRREVADRYGVSPEDVADIVFSASGGYAKLQRASQALGSIASLLSGKSWSPGDLDEIADIMRHAGYAIDEAEGQ